MNKNIIAKFKMMIENKQEKSDGKSIIKELFLSK